MSQTIGQINDRNHPAYGNKPAEMYAADDGFEVIYEDDKGRLYVADDEIGKAVIEWKAGGRCWVKCSCCEEYICGIHGTHVFECTCPPLIDWNIDPYDYIGKGRAKKMLAGEYYPWNLESSLD